MSIGILGMQFTGSGSRSESDRRDMQADDVLKSGERRQHEEQDRGIEQTCRDRLLEWAPLLLRSPLETPLSPQVPCFATGTI